MTLPADPAPDAEGGCARTLTAALIARLLAGSSATAVLDAWCAERGLSQALVGAERLPGPERPPGAAQHRRLALAADETVRHRRVRLVCGTHILSLADNWYVPGRLTPAMNHSLQATRVPFGRVVHALAPVRRTLAVRLRVGSAAAPRPDDPLFAVTAHLATPDGVPFCEVEETYLGAVLGM